MAQPVLSHRVVLNSQAEAEGVSATSLIAPLTKGFTAIVELWHQRRTSKGPPFLLCVNILALNRTGDDAAMTA